MDFRGSYYYVRYRGSWLTIEKDYEQIFEQCLNQEDELDGEWSAEETTVYLFLISRAIESGDFSTLTLPGKEQAKSHPMYVPGPHPLYVFVDCKEEHDHDFTKCPVIHVSPMALAKAREEYAAKRTVSQRIAGALKRMLR